MRLASLFDSSPESKASVVEDPLLPWLQIPRLHELLPYEAYEESTKLFYNKESTGFVLYAEPLVGASLEDQGQLANFFREKENLPEGSSLQFLLIASPQVGPFLDYWAEARYGVFRDFSQRRVDFLKEKISQPLGETLLRDYRLLISYTVPGTMQEILEKEKLLDVRRNLMSVLGLVGVPSVELEAEGLVRELRSLLNFKGHIYPGPVAINDHESLSRQLLEPDMFYGIREKELTLPGEKILRSYIPKEMPKHWALPHMDRFLGDLLQQGASLTCPFLLHYGFFVEQNQGNSKRKAFARRESLENSLKNKLTKWMAGLEEQYEEIDECITELNRGERFIISSLSVSLFSDPTHLPFHEAKLKNIWNKAGFEVSPCLYEHLPVFLGSLPMTWTWGEKKEFSSLTVSKSICGYGPDLLKMGKARKTISREAQNMLPLLAEWKGQRSPGMLLYGRRGQLFTWSPFGEALKETPRTKTAQTDHNYNLCVTGTSGSGKSVFMQELMMSVLGVGGKVFVIDYGQSFKKSCYLLEGEHVEFDLRSPLSLNPFKAIPTGEDSESRATREDLLGALKVILQEMAAPTMGTTDLQNSLLDLSLRKAWSLKGQDTTLDDIRNLLLERDDQTSKDLGHMLYPFSSEGTYGAFFRGEPQVNFKSNLVVFETDHLRNHPSLLNVIIQMKILNINQHMAQGSRKDPFLIVIDEAWKALRGKQAGIFGSELPRTIRKYRGSIVVGTQFPTDFFDKECPAATHAFNCSAWKVFLYQEGETIRALKNHESLGNFVDSEFKEELFRSIRSKPPYYSEVLIYGPGVNGVVGRLSLDPFSRLLYSTNPQEYEAIQGYIDQGISVFESIQEVLKREKNGL